MNFFKNRSYDIIKLFINQAGIAIFSLVLYTAVSFIDDQKLFSQINLFLSLFATLFYFGLLYTVAWDYGARDKIKMDSGKLSTSSFAGLKMSFVANLPNFIIAFLAILSMGLYLLLNQGWLYDFFAIMNLLIRFGCSMFLGIIQSVFSFLETSDEESNQFLYYYFFQAIGYLIMPLFSMAVTHFGYVLGMKEKRLFGFFSTKKH